MSGKPGDLFLLKGGDGEISEVFTTIDALRTTNVSINGEVVPITSKDSGGWRELLDGGGEGHVVITAEGVWKATAEQKELRAKSISKALRNYQVDDGDDILEGAFQVASFEHGGDSGREQTYSVTIESSGEVAVAD